jgi:hypothetical protein
MPQVPVGDVLSETSRGYMQLLYKIKNDRCRSVAIYFLSIKFR